MSHRFMTGDTVRVDGQVVLIRQVLSDVPGGYLVDRPVAGFRYWNQDEMRPVTDDLAALRARLATAEELLSGPFLNCSTPIVDPCRFSDGTCWRHRVRAFLADSPATPALRDKHVCAKAHRP